jgi:hypothetical protein
MDTLAVATSLLIVAALATRRWLNQAPVGYEDGNGFHTSVDVSTADEYEPMRTPSQPPFLPHGL